MGGMMDFVMLAVMLGGGVFVFMNKDAILEMLKLPGGNGTDPCATNPSDPACTGTGTGPTCDDPACTSECCKCKCKDRVNCPEGVCCDKCADECPAQCGGGGGGQSATGGMYDDLVFPFMSRGYYGRRRD